MPAPDPARFQENVRAIEAADAESPPPRGAVLFIGSSSFTYWDTLARDMAPLAVVNRGFGGSTMTDALHYIDRLVLPCAPRAVVLYEGDNDLHFGEPIDRIVDGCAHFAERLAEALPEARLYIVATKPSPNRTHLADAQRRLNETLKAFCAEADSRTFIDANGALVDAEGAPDPSLYRDGLHFNEEGYRRWGRAIREGVAGEEEYEGV